MIGMLLCLNTEQRAILVIGDIFEIPNNIASEIFNISKENFRKKLSRARSDLYGFMNNYCGLINHKNQCRCKLKTKALIEEKYLNPNHLSFSSKSQKSLQQELQLKSDNLDATMENLYKDLYQKHPFCNADEKEFAKNILKNKEIKEIFNF